MGVEKRDELDCCGLRQTASSEQWLAAKTQRGELAERDICELELRDFVDFWTNLSDFLGQQ